MMTAGIGWQVPRLCGLGRSTGAGCSARCTRSATTTCVVEHEDRRFEGSDELVKRGFLIARNTLRPLLA